jgi:transposase
VDTMEHFKRAGRRRHNDALKSKVLSECAVPGASVAQVALAHGVNANLARRWIFDASDVRDRESTVEDRAVAPTRPDRCAANIRSNLTGTTYERRMHRSPMDRPLCESPRSTIASSRSTPFIQIATTATPARELRMWRHFFFTDGLYKPSIEPTAFIPQEPSQSFVVTVREPLLKVRRATHLSVISSDV